jgi:CheY-like chemotaxis protein
MDQWLADYAERWEALTRELQAFVRYAGSVGGHLAALDRAVRNALNQGDAELAALASEVDQLSAPLLELAAARRLLPEHAEHAYEPLAELEIRPGWSASVAGRSVYSALHRVRPELGGLLPSRVTYCRAQALWLFDHSAEATTSLPEVDRVLTSILYMLEQPRMGQPMAELIQDCTDTLGKMAEELSSRIQRRSVVRDSAPRYAARSWTVFVVEDDLALTTDHLHRSQQGKLRHVVSALGANLPRSYTIDALYWPDTASAEQAMSNHRQADPQGAALVVLDLGLPASPGAEPKRENGKLLLRKLREDWQVDWPIFVFTSGSHRFEDFLETYQYSIEGYLLKDDDERLLGELLRARIVAPQAPVTCERIEDSNCFKMNDRVIELTASKAKLLSHLLGKGFSSFADLADFDPNPTITLDRNALLTQLSNSARRKLAAFMTDLPPEEAPPIEALIDAEWLESAPFELHPSEIAAWLQLVEPAATTDGAGLVETIGDLLAAPAISGYNYTQAINDLREQIDNELAKQNDPFDSRRQLILSVPGGYRVECAPAAAIPAAQRRRKVLLAEDDPNLRERLAALAGKLCVVREAASIEETLAIAREWKPDLLALDINLPVTAEDARLAATGAADRAQMDPLGALTVLEALGKDGLTPRTLIFSSRLDDMIATRLVRAGVKWDHLIPKEAPIGDASGYDFFDSFVHELTRADCLIRNGYQLPDPVRLYAKRSNLKFAPPAFCFADLPRRAPLDGPREHMTVSMSCPGLDIEDYKLQLAGKQGRLFWHLAFHAPKALSKQFLEDSLGATPEQLRQMVFRLRQALQASMDRVLSKHDANYCSQLVKNYLVAEAGDGYRLEAAVGLSRPTAF